VFVDVVVTDTTGTSSAKGIEDRYTVDAFQVNGVDPNSANPSLAGRSR